MIIITGITVPDQVIVRASFAIEVSLIELPSEYIIYCSSIYSGQLFNF